MSWLRRIRLLSEVAEGVYRVPARGANTYLAEGEEGLLLVDTGLPGSENRIYEAIDKLGRKPGDVKIILITHSIWTISEAQLLASGRQGRPWWPTSSRNRTSPGP